MPFWCLLKRPKVEQLQLELSDVFANSKYDRMGQRHCYYVTTMNIDRVLAKKEPHKPWN